ncbi:ester cyclase [Gluconobacter japonicus]
MNVVISWFWSGTHKGDLPGFPTTNRAIRMSGMTIYAFDGEDCLNGFW